MCRELPCRDPQGEHGEWSADGRTFRPCGHAPIPEDRDGAPGWCNCSPRLCTRWGIGKDRCILPFDHIGPDRDAQGRDTLSMAREVLARSVRKN